MFIKYPRIAHIPGSHSAKGDKVLSRIPSGVFRVFEKIDGASLGVSFKNGKIQLQNRGGYLDNKRPHEQWDAAKNWAYENYDSFSQLKDGEIIFGEWLYARHSVKYTTLPSYFLGYDVYLNGFYREFSAVKNRLEELGLTMTPQIAVSAIDEIVPHSALYGEWYEGFIYRDIADYSQVYKWVRKEFSAGITGHWFNRKVEVNGRI